MWKFNLLVLRHSLNPGPYLVLRNRNEHSRAGLDIEGLDPKGGNLSESRSLYSGSGSAMKQMGPRTLAWHRSQELTWISKGSTPGAATFLNPYPYMLEPRIRNETNGASNTCAAPFSRELTWISKGSTPGAATLTVKPRSWMKTTSWSFLQEVHSSSPSLPPSSPFSFSCTHPFLKLFYVFNKQCTDTYLANVQNKRSRNSFIALAS